jgi:tRNA(fMet)-specific endonuclease VapC
VIQADSDTIVEILRRNPKAQHYLQYHLQQFGHLAISAVTLFEVERGLHIRQAAVQREQMNLLRPYLAVLAVTEEVALRTANLYASLRDTNQLLPDADLLVAATALHHDLTLATSNGRHFGRIPALRLVDWREEAVD